MWSFNPAVSRFKDLSWVFMIGQIVGHVAKKNSTTHTRFLKFLFVTCILSSFKKEKLGITGKTVSTIVLPFTSLYTRSGFPSKGNLGGVCSPHDKRMKMNPRMEKVLAIFCPFFVVLLLKQGKVFFHSSNHALFISF